MKLYFFSIIFALLFIGCASQMSLEQILSITPKSQYNQNERSIAIRSSERAEYEVWLKIYKGYEGVDNEAYFYATLYQVEENPVAMNTINTRLALKFEQELATELGIEVVDIQRIWEEGLRKGWPLRYKNEIYPIWIKLCKIDEMAGNEALVGHIPFDDPASTDDDRMEVHAIYLELMTKYKKELAEELGIGMDVIESITNEGLRRGWPLRFKDGSE